MMAMRNHKLIIQEELVILSREDGEGPRKSHEIFLNSRSEGTFVRSFAALRMTD